MKNNKDLRIMLKEYLRYRRPRGNNLKSVDCIMQKYLSQDEYFMLMKLEKEEQDRKNAHY